MGKKPLYVVIFKGGPWDGQYYSHSERWQGVPKERAEKMTHKEARAVQGHMRCSGIRQATDLEPAND